METKEHKERHKQLHRSLDELIADFITLNPDKRLVNTSVMELMEWSARQMDNPDEKVE